MRDILAEEDDLAAKCLKARKKNGSYPNAARFFDRRLNAEVDRIERHGLHLLGNVIFKDFKGQKPRRWRKYLSEASERGRKPPRSVPL